MYVPYCRTEKHVHIVESILFTFILPDDAALIRNFDRESYGIAGAQSAMLRHTQHLYNMV